MATLTHPGISFKQKNHIYYLLDKNGKIMKFKPWLGDLFSFLYDRIMEKSIFPNKFNGDISKHLEILQKEFKDIHHKKILEIATGSGNAAFFLNQTNDYTGIDISRGLLKKAYKRFQKKGFENISLYITSAENLPFQHHVFDLAICNLSLNFFDDCATFIQQLKQVLKPAASFFCSVPIPERKPENSKIRGRLYSVNELKKLFERNNFSFEPKADQNGALLYFSATLN